MNNNSILSVPEFNNGDGCLFLQTLNEGWAENFVSDCPASQEILKQDANVCQLGDEVTFNISELLLEVPIIDQCNVVDDDDFFNLPAFDKSFMESLPVIEPESNNSKQQQQQQQPTDDEAIQSDGFCYDTTDLCQSPMTLARNLAIVSNPLGFGFSEPAGLKEVEELAKASMEQIDPNCIGWNAPIFSTHLMDWGFSQHIARAPNSLCQACQIMRRIIHSNGIQDSRLEIHGFHGQPHHAISECRPCVDDGKESSLNREMIEFPTRNLEHAKQFVAQYNHVRRNEGSILRHDTFLMNALTAIGPDKPKFGWPGWDIDSQVTEFNPIKSISNQRASSTSNYLPKSSYSAQRQRTGKIQMSELASFFHLPITEAAKCLRICPTVIKKICRRNGLRRWPHRKIKSIERLIQSLKLSLVGGNREANESVKSQIVSLKNEQTRLYGGFID